MINQYGDTITGFVEDMATDEFEAATYHKADSVSHMTVLPATALVAAILAWTLPGRESLWSLTLLLIPSISSFAGTQWMRNYVAHPVMSVKKMPRSVVVTYFALVAVWLAGIMVSMASAGDLEFSSATVTGAIVGGLVGGIAAGAWYGYLSRRRRRDDEARLNASYED